jgi:predicted nuclease with TOPRIM domain
MEKLKNEFDELKKDQDDLLELLSDQQLKIGEYRERLKSGGLPVTDEEDLDEEI